MKKLAIILLLLLCFSAVQAKEATTESTEPKIQADLYLVSDQDWKNVLPLIPIIYKKGERKADLLIYHQEGETVDLDSISHAINQYNFDRIILVEPYPKTVTRTLTAKTGFLEKNWYNIKRPEVPKENIFTINLENDFNRFWKGYEKVIYVQDRYDMSLIASTYASFIDAPLIIQKSKLDKKENLEGKEIICVGQTNYDKCSRRLETIPSLQIEILSTIKSTDDFIVVDQETGQNTTKKIMQQIFLEQSTNFTQRTLLQHQS